MRRSRAPILVCLATVACAGGTGATVTPASEVTAPAGPNGAAAATVAAAYHRLTGGTAGDVLLIEPGTALVLDEAGARAATLRLEDGRWALAEHAALG